MNKIKEVEIGIKFDFDGKEFRGGRIIVLGERDGFSIEDDSSRNVFFNELRDVIIGKILYPMVSLEYVAKKSGRNLTVDEGKKLQKFAEELFQLK